MGCSRKIADDLIFILDENGQYLDIVGWEGGDRYRASRGLIGQHIRDVMPAEEADRFLAAITRVSKTTHLEVLEYSLDMADGPHWFEARISIAPTKSLWSEEAVALHSLDVTEQRARETVLLAEQAALKSRLAQQSADLEDVEVRAKLQDRLAAVGQLAAGVAHDFNNILTVMMGFSELIAMAPNLPEKTKSQLAQIHKEGQQAEQLIRQILDFSRQTKIDSRPLDLVPFVKESVKLLRQALPETIQLHVESEDPSCVVQSNITQLNQIITNLVLNARDASQGDGDVVIKLSNLEIGPEDTLIIESSTSSIVPRLESGAWVVVKVCDSGCGIPPDVLPRIFDPFFSTKAPGKGTGLGLSQVYGIVKQHGGYVDVQSEVGTGTVITVYLKRESAEVSPYAVEEGGIAKGSGELILLVEDRESVLQTVKTMLDELGYTVVTSHNGREALEVFGAEQGDVKAVVTDVVMPEMGGGQLATELRRRASGIPIVMMTGHQLSEEEEMAMVPGTVELLRKPLLLHDLAHALKRALVEV